MSDNSFKYLLQLPFFFFFDLLFSEVEVLEDINSIILNLSSTGLLYVAVMRGACVFYSSITYSNLFHRVVESV